MNISAARRFFGCWRSIRWREALENLRLADLPEELPLLAGLMRTEPAALNEFELTEVQVADELAAWLCVMEKDGAAAEVESVTIIGGHNKSGEPENIELTVRVGEVISIVGPTGAGKSRLLPASSRWRGRWYRCAAPCSCCR